MWCGSGTGTAMSKIRKHYGYLAFGWVRLCFTINKTSVNLLGCVRRFVLEMSKHGVHSSGHTEHASIQAIFESRPENEIGF